VLGAAVGLRDGEIVLEGTVRAVERVLELIPLEDVVVAPRRVCSAVMRIDGAANGPHRTGLALDPDDDAFLVAGVVDSMELPLREPAAVGRDLHKADYTIGRVPLKVASFLRNPFSFLFARSSKEEAVVAYVLREHGAGRRVDEILEDPYVKNRLSPEQQKRMLSRADLIKALSDQDR
jgi:hypothetical protein